MDGANNRKLPGPPHFFYSLYGIAPVILSERVMTYTFFYALNVRIEKNYTGRKSIRILIA